MSLILVSDNMCKTVLLELHLASPSEHWARLKKKLSRKHPSREADQTDACMYEYIHQKESSWGHISATYSYVVTWFAAWTRMGRSMGRSFLFDREHARSSHRLFFLCVCSKVLHSPQKNAFDNRQSTQPCGVYPFLSGGRPLIMISFYDVIALQFRMIFLSTSTNSFYPRWLGLVKRNFS